MQCKILGAPVDESVAQECSHGDERGFPEAPRKDLSQNLHPASRQRQVRSSNRPDSKPIAVTFEPLVVDGGHPGISDLHGRA